MLRSVNSLDGYGIQATDSELGSIKELYFDDERWGIRYLVVETGTWLNSRRVLISPYSINKLDEAGEAVEVSLTREQVKNSPDIDTHQPISRQLEGDHSQYYGYGNYWAGPYLWGITGYPESPIPGDSVPSVAERTEDAAQRLPDQSQDTHLRSSTKVRGYHILGIDEEIGHVQDFIFDDEDWAIRYLVVDTHNWWPGGKKILLGTQWIAHIDWIDSIVQTKLTRQQIKDSPEYVETAPLDRDYETELHRFYGEPGYWTYP